MLAALLVLLLGEEARYRHLAQRVAETQKTLAVFAHQLRSPLAALRKYNLFMRDKAFGKLSLTQIDVLGKMDAATDESVLLLNRLIAGSRIEEGKIESHPVRTDLCDCLEAAINAVAGFIEERKHIVRFASSARSIFVFADPLLLHGIFDEILQNAAVYTLPEGTITVTAKNVGNKASVTVRDTGIGIPPEEQGCIFEKFYRGKRAIDLYKNGHGLGLCFAQQFSKSMGGAIRFDSKKNKGTTFTVILPIATT